MLLIVTQGQKAKPKNLGKLACMATLSKSNIFILQKILKIVIKILSKHMSFPSVILNVWFFGSNNNNNKSKHGSVITMSF